MTKGGKKALLDYFFINCYTITRILRITFENCVDYSEVKVTKDNNRYHKRNGLLNGVIGLAVAIVFVCALGQGNLRKEVHGEEQIRPEGGTSESVMDDAAESSYKADDSYFSSSLLVGDSRAETLGLYSGLADWDVCAARDLDIETVESSKIAKDRLGNACTVADMLAGTSYDSIYISFGIGELGWYKERFISAYRTFLDKVTTLQPSAKIYVMSIIPVSAQLSSEDSVYNNPGIDSFNIGLQELCRAYDNVEYLDVAGSVAVDGVLPDDAGTDGIHFNKEYSLKIIDHIRQNAAIER